MSALYHVADDPITVLVKALQASQYLRGIAQVYLGAPGAARVTAPGRVVVFPTAGTGEAPAHPLGGARGQVALRDVVQTIRAEVWASDLPHVWDAIKRLVWAVEEAATANDSGLFWTLAGLDWETAQDATKQGTGCDVHFTARLPIPPAPTGTGTIESYAINPA